MEKDGSLGGNPRADFNWAAQGMEMNLDSAGNSSFLNLNNWEQSPAHDAQAANFESALSSFVSSPTTTTSAAACNNPSPDSIVIRELIGRLGSICNNNNSSSSSNYQSTSSSCYATPLSSPPKLNISIPQFPPPTPMGVDFVTDSGFAERAARYSCFGAARNYAQFGELSSGQSLKENDMTRMMMMMSRPDWDLGLNANNCVKSSNARDDSVTPSSEGNVGRKRKATLSSSSSSSKGSRGGRNDAHHNPPKASEDEKSKSKRCKPLSAAAEAKGDDKETVKAPNVEQKNSAAEKQNGKDKESNAEHPKQDFIHVRARRGQATDSHSLAERVRREKISERMKFLQDLVPGCNKVTGKAVMLDEIINYVQALQGQVEFLSMKLATVNPQMDQPRGPMLPPQSSYPLEATGSCGFSYANQPQGQGPPLQSLMGSNAALETQLDPSYLNLDGFTDHATSAPQPGAFWEDDLHSVVQMGFVQNHAVSSHNLQGAPGPTRDMKLEL